MILCGWWSTSCGTGGIYSQAPLSGAAGRRAAGGRRAPHPTAGASDDIWCTIGTRGKWDYGTGNGIDSLLDRFTDPHWIEYRRKGCKTHHLWGELHTAWNNLFGLGNPHSSLAWFTPLTPHPSSPILVLVCCTVFVISSFSLNLRPWPFDLLAACTGIIPHCINNCTSHHRLLRYNLNMSI